MWVKLTGGGWGKDDEGFEGGSMWDKSTGGE